MTPERQVLEARGAEPGPTLVVVVAMHGNEPAGVQALARLKDRLAAAGGIERGRVVGVVGNLEALAAEERYLDRDLNRLWDLPAHQAARFREGKERRALTRFLARVRREGRGPLHVVDLHTTSGRGPAFTIVPVSAWGRAEADALPIPRVTGIFGSLQGTFGGWLDRMGIPNLTLEAGSHRDPASVDRGEAVLRILLGRLGLLGPRWLDPDGARERLSREGKAYPPVLEVIHRHAIVPEDEFRMEPGFRNLQPVRAGMPLARDRRGPVTAPRSGWLLFPLYQPRGEDGFLLAGTAHPQGEHRLSRSRAGA